MKSEDEVFDAHSIGAPTFEEFKKNPDKWRSRPEEVLESVERSGTLFKGQIRRHVYYIEGYRCQSLEEVQRVARQMGIREQDLETRTELIDVGGLKCDAHVRFFSKESLKRREGWG